MIMTKKAERPKIIGDIIKRTELILELPYTRIILIIYPVKERLLRIKNITSKKCEIEISLTDINEDLERSIAYGLLVDHLIPAKGSPSRLINDIKAKILRVWLEEELRVLFKEYKNMTPNLMLKPEWFIVQHYERKGRLLFMLRSHYTWLAEEALKMIKKERHILRKVLEKALHDDLLTFDRELLRISCSSKKLSSATFSLRPGVSITSIFPLTLLSYLIRMSMSYNEKLRNIETQYSNEYYILVDTDRGPKPLDAEYELWRRMQRDKFKLKKLGGVLNTAYLLEHENKERVVIKLFREWTDFKWLPLAFWALGAYLFDPTGKGRLINEYSMNREFRRHGFSVPDIYHVDLANKLIVEEYIEGFTFRDFLLKLLREGLERNSSNYELLMKIMTSIARVHNKGLVLGDANPTNIIIKKPIKEIFFVDLEQARRGEKYSWDLATIFFFTAHYVQGITLKRFESVLEAMIEGYLSVGEKKVIKDALKVPYLRVYAFFAYPHAIFKLYRCVNKILRETRA